MDSQCWCESQAPKKVQCQSERTTGRFLWLDGSSQTENDLHNSKGHLIGRRPNYFFGAVVAQSYALKWGGVPIRVRS